MSEYLKCGAKRKFMVFKIEYLDILCANQIIKNAFQTICGGYDDIRRRVKNSEGKADLPDPEYLVINTDEPYINEIIEILKKNNHWG